MFVLFFGWIIMFVSAKGWVSRYLRDIFSELPTERSGSAVDNRLRVYLSEAKLFNGETPHSFRVGLSNTLSILDCSPEEIAQYLGWKSSDMARHYFHCIYNERITITRYILLIPRVWVSGV